jgi:hypothetical protein
LGLVVLGLEEAGEVAFQVPVDGFGVLFGSFLGQ